MAQQPFPNPNVARIQDRNVTSFFLNFNRVLTDNFVDIQNKIRGRPERLTTTANLTNYSAILSDQIILMDATLGAITVTLPSPAATHRRTFTIKKLDTTNTVTVLPNNAEIIDGAASYVMAAGNKGAVDLYSDGTNWLILNYYLG